MNSEHEDMPKNSEGKEYRMHPYSEKEYSKDDGDRRSRSRELYKEYYGRDKNQYLEKRYQGVLPRVIPGREQPYPMMPPSQLPPSGYGKASEDLDLSDAMLFLSKVKDEYKHDPSTYDQFLELMRDYKHGKVEATGVIRAVSNLFKNKPNLIKGFNDFLPSDFKVWEIPRRQSMVISTKEPEDLDKQSQAYNYIVRVKKRLSGEPETYRAFLEIIRGYQNNRGPTGVVLNQLKRVIGNYPDLIKGFMEFMPDERKPSDVLEKIRKVLEEKNAYDDFLKCLNLKNQGLINNRDLMIIIKPLINNKELINGFQEYIKYEPIEIGTKEKLKNCKKIGSYRILYDEFSNFDYDFNFNSSVENVSSENKSTENKSFENEDRILDLIKEGKISVKNDDILNNICVSVPTLTSEDGDFNNSYRSYFEETLYRVEEERYEFEILIERATSLILSLENINKLNLEEVSIEDFEMPASIIIEILFYIYDKKSDEILEEILNKPNTAIPIVLERLYLMVQQWKREYRGRSEGWREVVFHNYYKALDCSGYEYKNLEKKMNSKKKIKEELEKGIEICIDYDALYVDKEEDVDENTDDNIKNTDMSDKESGEIKESSEESGEIIDNNESDYNKDIDTDRESNNDRESGEVIDDRESDDNKESGEIIDNKESDNDRESDDNKESNNNKESDDSKIENNNEIMNIFNIIAFKLENNDKNPKSKAFPKVKKMLIRIINLLFKDEFEIKVDFLNALLIRYISMIFEMVSELKRIPIKQPKKHPIAVELGINQINEYMTPMKALREFIKEKIYNIEFENIVRILTECKGYKIYIIDNVLDKIYRTALNVDQRIINKYFKNENKRLKTNNLNKNESENENESYLVKKNGNRIFMKFIGE